MKVLYLYTDSKNEWNSSEWRCKMPHDAINRTSEHQSRMRSLIDCTMNNNQVDIQWADIIILQRNAFGDVLGYIYQWRSQGKVVVLDLDDAYHLMPTNVIASPFWRNGEFQRTKSEPFQKLPFKPVDHLEYGARLCNAVTTPSPMIAEYWSPFTTAYVVPNYPPMLAFKDKQPLFKSLRPVIGWGGSFCHVDSFLNSNIGPALKRVMERFNARLVITGGDVRVKNAIRIRKAEMMHWYPYSEWPSILMSFTVGIAPLAGLYDRFRSHIKVLDYMIAGIPWVASDDYPYQHLRQYGALVKNQSKYWEDALSEAIVHPDRNRIDRAREYAMDQDIDLNVHKIIWVYQKIIDEKRMLI